MDSPDEPSFSAREAGEQYWARVESTHESQVADLEHAAKEIPPLSIGYFAKMTAVGVAAYVALAIAFVTLCLCCNRPPSVDPSDRVIPMFTAPKYLTSIERQSKK